MNCVLCVYCSLLNLRAGEGVGVAGAEDIDLSVIDDFADGWIIIGDLVEGLFISRRDNNLLGHTSTCLTCLTLFRAIDTVLAFMAYRERDILRLALPEKTVLAERAGLVLTQIRLIHLARRRSEVGQLIMSVATDDESDGGDLLAFQTLYLQRVVRVQSQEQSRLVVLAELRAAGALGFLRGEAEETVSGGEIRRGHL